MGLIENHFRQDKTVGDNHRYVRLKRCKSFLLRLTAKSFGRAHLEAPSFGEGMDRTRFLVVAAASRARRVGINGHDLVVGVDQCTECWQREVG